jgi:hypothetical protein
MSSQTVDAWIDAVITRHSAAFTTSELTRAIRAVSIRYVQRRQTISKAPLLDSAGKRAAFAAFYAPLHLLTAMQIVGAIGPEPASVDRIVDLGCGTGVASAAWALACETPPRLRGIDTVGWALGEAAWNWRQLGLTGSTERADLVASTTRLDEPRGRKALAGTGVVLGWSVNELAPDANRVLLPALLKLAASGARVLVIEPLARAATPWWDEWRDPFVAAGGRVDEWKFDLLLPPRLAALDEAAGFQREHLGARSLWLAGPVDGRSRRR